MPARSTAVATAVIWPSVKPSDSNKAKGDVVNKPPATVAVTTLGLAVVSPLNSIAMT